MLANSVLLIMGLLAIGFLSTRLATAFKIPHSVFLVLLGLMSGFLLNASGHPATLDLQQQFPDLIIYILLPPLIFESAYRMDWTDLRRDIVPVVALSVVALLISTALIGAGLHWLLRLDMIPALLFGALISATDPVAVVALFREVGAPRRLGTLVEGESLLNDGTAIVLFGVLSGMLDDPARGTLAAGLLRFAWVAGGGIAVGYGFIVVARLLLRFTARSHSAQLGLTVAIAYFSFIVAQSYLGVSGVMSTLTAGLYLGHRARLTLNREALHGMRSLWDFVALSANTLVFLMVGFAVRPQYIIASLEAIPPTLLIVYLARAVSVPATLMPLNRLGLMEPVGLRYQAMLVWGGLRGGLALALSLLLPDSLETKPLFIALATTVVLSTLLINAVSIRPTLRLLKLDRLNVIDEAFYRNSLSVVLGQVFNPLRQATRTGTLSEALLDDMESTARKELLRSDDDGRPLPPECHEAFEIQQILLDEQQYYNIRLENEALSRAAYDALSHTVSARLAAYRQKGMQALLEWQFDFHFAPVRSTLFRSEKAELQKLAVTLEVLLNLEFGLGRLLAFNPHCADSALVTNWAAQVREKLDELYRAYPQAGVVVQSRFVADAVAATAEHTLQEMFDADVINGSVHTRAVARIEELHRLQLETSHQLLHPSLLYLLSHVPLLADVPNRTLTDVALVARRRSLAAGATVVRAGDEGDSFFIVLTGLLEAEHSVYGTLPNRVRFFPGSYFGEMSMPFGTRRSATVAAVLPSEVAELDRFTFEALMANHPQVAQAVRKSAWDRLSQLEEVRAPSTAEHQPQPEETPVDHPSEGS